MGLFQLFLFRFRNNRIHGTSISKRTLLDLEKEYPWRIEVTWKLLCLRILSIPSKPYSFHSVHSAVGIRMNGMIFHSFRKRNSSQKNTNTVYSGYSYSEIAPKERALSDRTIQNTLKGQLVTGKR